MHAELSSICCVPFSHGLKKDFWKILFLCAGSVMIVVLYCARTQEKQTQHLKKQFKEI